MSDEIKTLKLKCEVCGYPVIAACPRCGRILCGTHSSHECEVKAATYEIKPVLTYETKPVEPEPKKRGRKPKQ